MATPAGLGLSITVDQRQLDAYLKRLDKNRGKPLLKRAENTAYAGAGLLRGPLRAAMPTGPARRIAGGPVRPGNLQRKVHTKLLRKRGSEAIRPTWVGSSAFYDRWLRMGTKGHSIEPRGAGAFSVTEWSGRTWTGTRLQRSPLAAFADGNVRPLRGIEVRGVTPNPYHTEVLAAHQSDLIRLFQANVFDVR